MRTALSRDELRSLYDRIARRYDRQHALLTARSDERGRRLVVEHAVRPGQVVLDCGAGTGLTSILAARRAGANGRVVLFDMSAGMLRAARDRMTEAPPPAPVDYATGDMHELPFPDGSFDAVLSTYSACPLRDPARGALELYRVCRRGGRVGIAHSAEPVSAPARWLADRVEALAWRFHSLSMGCRAVSVLPALEEAGGRVVFRKRIGVPLWPFLVLVVEKPS